MVTPLPRVTVVASAALPRWWMMTPLLLNSLAVDVPVAWVIATAFVPMPTVRATVRDVESLCSAVLTTMPLPFQTPAAVVLSVIVVAPPPVTVSATSPAMPWPQTSDTSYWMPLAYA